MFDYVDVKAYVRTDAAGNRIGFIARDTQQQLSPEFGSMASTQYGGDELLSAVDYSRLVCVCVLRGVWKNRQTWIEALETATAKKSTVKRQRLPVLPNISQKKVNMCVCIIFSLLKMYLPTVVYHKNVIICVCC